MINKLSITLTELRTKYAELEQDFQDMSRNYNELKQDFQEMERKYNELEQNFQEMERKYNELEQNFQEMERKYNKEYKKAVHHLFRKIELMKAMKEIADANSKVNTENLILKAKLALSHYEMEEFKFMKELENAARNV